MTGIEIRPRRDDDLAALGGVLVRVHDTDGYPVEGVANPVGWLTPPHQLIAWTALDNNQPVGHVALAQATSADEVARIWQGHTQAGIDRLAIPARLFVDPAHRSHGMGGLLMAAVAEHARTHGLLLAFDVMLKDQAAIRLYEAAGCVRIGTVAHNHGQDLTEPGAVYTVPTT